MLCTVPGDLQPTLLDTTASLVSLLKGRQTMLKVLNSPGTGLTNHLTSWGGSVTIKMLKKQLLISLSHSESLRSDTVLMFVRTQLPRCCEV